MRRRREGWGDRGLSLVSRLSAVCRPSVGCRLSLASVSHLGLGHISARPRRPVESLEQLATQPRQRLLRLEAERPTEGERDEEQRDRELGDGLQQARAKVKRQPSVPPPQALSVRGEGAQMAELAQNRGGLQRVGERKHDGDEVQLPNTERKKGAVKRDVPTRRWRGAASCRCSAKRE